jgi:hypothetical protein
MQAPLPRSGIAHTKNFTGGRRLTPETIPTCSDTQIPYHVSCMGCTAVTKNLFKATVLKALCTVMAILQDIKKKVAGKSMS